MFSKGTYHQVLGFWIFYRAKCEQKLQKISKKTNHARYKLFFLLNLQK